MSTVHLAKAASIQRSVRRAKDEFAAAGEAFDGDLTRQDVAVHRYRDLDLAVLASVITRDVDDLTTFSELVAQIA